VKPHFYLELCRVPPQRGQPNDTRFVITTYARRISFETQQRRAFNLAYCLTSTGTVDTVDSDVAVVGGGISGLTVAAALAMQGVRVHVFETEERPLHKQRETSHRYIHPSINFWPNEKLECTTHLPFMNWQQGRCDKVVGQVIEDWNQIQELCAHSLKLYSSSKVITVQANLTDKNNWNVIFENDPQSYTRPAAGYKAVIFAAGFGNENERNELGDHKASPSYWQTVSKPTDETKIYISGAGDGGLVECFDWLFDNVPIILEILVNYFDKCLSAEDKRLLSENRWDASQYTKIAQDHADKIESLKRGGISLLTREGARHSVVIVEKRIDVFSLNSSPIHKLLLAICENKSQVVIHSESCLKNTSEEESSVENKHPFKITGKHCIIDRHGADDAFESLLNEAERDQLKELSRFRDFDFDSIWQGEFPVKIRLPSQFVHEKARKALRSWLERIGIHENFELEIRDDCYRMYISSNLVNNEIRSLFAKKVIVESDKSIPNLILEYGK